MEPELETYLFPLVANGACPAGTFKLEAGSGLMEWSVGLYRIHGFRPGEVVPTLAVLMAHQHPDDREPVGNLLRRLVESGGQGALLHRVIDSHGRQRQVFSSIQARKDDGAGAGQLVGFMVDLTRTMHEESRQAAEDAIQGAFAHKATIEQAKGIIMACLNLAEERAFDVLTKESQKTNTKVHTLAGQLVQAASEGHAARMLAQWAAAPTSRF